MGILNSKFKESIVKINMENNESASSKIVCSFCNLDSDSVSMLIAGPNNINICDRCIEVCVTILNDNDNEKGEWHLRILKAIKHEFVPNVEHH